MFLTNINALLDLFFAILQLSSQNFDFFRGFLIILGYVFRYVIVRDQQDRAKTNYCEHSSKIKGIQQSDDVEYRVEQNERAQAAYQS